MSFFANTSSGQQGASSTGGNLFGGTNNSTTQPAGGLFGNTTTAAPAGSTGTTGSPFSGFGNISSNTGATSGTPTAPTSGGGLFGGAGSNNTPPAPAGGLFGTTATPAPNATTGTTPAGGFLSGFGQPKPADQNAPKPGGASSFFAQPSTNTANTTSSTPSFFGTNPTTTSTSTATTPNPVAAPAPAAGGGLFSGNLFGKKPDMPTAGASTPGAGTISGTTTTPAPGLFGLGGSTSTGTPATSAAPGAASASAPAPTLFGSTANKPEEKKDNAPTAPAAAPAFGLFGAPKKPEEKKDGDKPKEANSAPATSTAGPTAATSFTQVAVPAPSILRGKTIEEIVNKWTAELEEQVKAFGKFASEVAVWDRALIESGNNLSALYATLLAAERGQNDVDQSLDHIEQQQRELSATLDAYEKVTDEILGSTNTPSQTTGGTGGLRSLDTGPADTERDRNYMLATELHGHLDDLSASLTQMIESVNALSPTSSNNLSASVAGDAASQTNNDDPLTQIAQVLANHLESLQWIDGAVREVEAKVVDVERRVRSAAGDGGSSVASPRLMGAGSVGPGGIGGDHGMRFSTSGR